MRGPSVSTAETIDATMKHGPRIVVTGSGAICGSGRTPHEVFTALLDGRSSIGPIRGWDASTWATRTAAEIADLDSRSLVRDRKLLKLIRRSDALGIYAASQALDSSVLPTWRDSLDAGSAASVSDRVGLYVGAGGGTYDNQYDFFPLLNEAGGDMPKFGAELDATVNPMWLLRSLPNNVLCHVGINYGLKGANACITNHSISGMLAIVEALAALRAGEADYAVAVGHDAPIEPQYLLYYQRVGLTARDALRPFDAARDGSLFGEGAGALVMETESAALARGAVVLGEVLGGGSASEAEGLLAIRDDGDGVVAAIEAALLDAGIDAGQVGFVVAHGNGTRASDASEVRALRSIFGDRMPPITASKWSIGHLLAASGAIDAVLALQALRRGIVPGIATLEALDPEFSDLAVSKAPVPARSDIALVISRGFGATNAALVIRGSRA